MNYDGEVLASLIGMAGFAVAAVLSAIGYLYRGWIVSKRSARKVLYLLLEIRYAISASVFNPSVATKEYIRYYTDRLSKNGFDVREEDIEASIEKIVDEHFRNIANAAKTDIEKRLLGPFEDALSDLSQDSPVLAYRLRGKEKIEVLAKLNATYASKVKEGIFGEIEEEWARQVVMEFTIEMEVEALKEMLKHLDEEILVLSSSCGWLERSRCKKVLSTEFGKPDDKQFSDLDKILDKILDKFIEAANKSIQ